mmetsp:Transcript_25481/g.49806  ORF Transcript_25481/g.49806 Transcript_25481/m.49806 type:complete len:151 (-) Transcript_25481:173-625(-)
MLITAFRYSRMAKEGRKMSSARPHSRNKNFADSTHKQNDVTSKRRTKKTIAGTVKEEKEDKDNRHQIGTRNLDAGIGRRGGKRKTEGKLERKPASHKDGRNQRSMHEKNNHVNDPQGRGCTCAHSFLDFFTQFIYLLIHSFIHSQKERSK